MAGIKISALPAAPSAQTTDIYPIVQGGVTYQLTTAQLQTLFGFSGGILALANGGTNANLTANNGGIFYSTASAGAILAGTATANQVLLSGSTAAPAWSTATYPATTTINQLLYSSSANVIAGLATGASGALVTSAGGVPSISTVLPAMTTSDPVTSQGIATKNYVDNIATGGGAPVVAATTGALTVTQAGAGVGATLTNAGAQTTFALDGQSPTVGQRVLVKNQTGGANTQNGVYTVTNVGSGSTNWVLTRATDYDTVSDINNTGIIPVQAGTVNANTGWINTTLMVTVDTTAITFIQFGVSFPVTVPNGGTGLTTTTAYGLITGGTTATGNFQNAGTGNSGDIYVSGGNAALGTWTAPTGTGSPVKANTPTLITPVLGAATATSLNFGASATNGSIGVTTNNNASTGVVGEFVSSVIAVASSISLSNNTPANVTSISLTAGDWDAWGNVFFTPGGTTTNIIGWISSVSATVPDQSLVMQLVSTITNPAGFPVPGMRFSLSGTTTIYLSVQSGFSVSETACGGIYARRRR